MTKDLRPKSVSAILLAAGRSVRMGAFKPLLPFGEKTVIESCVDYLTAGGVNSVVVVLGHRADHVRQQLHQTSVTFALNPDPASEMSDSIRWGVQMLPQDSAAILIAPVDHPAVHASVITALIAAWAKGAHLVIPTHEGRGGHPVLIDARYRDDLEELPPRQSLRSLFEKHPESVKRLEVASPYIARDMDTWDDYIRLYTEVFGKVPPRQPESNERPNQAI